MNQDTKSERLKGINAPPTAAEPSAPAQSSRIAKLTEVKKILDFEALQFPHPAVDQANNNETTSTSDPDDLEHLSSSEPSSTEKSPVESPRSPKSVNPNKSAEIVEDDLTKLRHKLKAISERHYRSLWAENGPLWQALHNQYMGKEKFQAFRPDIHLMQKKGNAAQALKYFIQAFFEQHIRGLPLNLSAIERTELTGINHLLAHVVTQLLQKVDHLPSKASLDTKVNCLQRLLAQMSDSEWETFYSNLKDKYPDLLRHYNHKRIRHLNTQSAIPLLPYDESTEQHFAYEQLAKLYRGDIDDFSLFNEAYGMADSTIDRETLSSHDTPYTVNNSVIQEVLKKFPNPRDNRVNSDFHRWDAYTQLTHQFTSYLKAIGPREGVNLIQSVNDILMCLEATQSPVLFLSSHKNCDGLTQRMKDFYNESYDEVYRHLYFSQNHYQNALARFLGINLPIKGLSQVDFISEVGKKLVPPTNAPPYKQQLASIIHAYGIGKLNHFEFQGELKLLASAHRPKSFWSRLGHYILTFFTQGYRQFSALRQQYRDINYLNQVIRNGFKTIQSNNDKLIAKVVVDDKLKVRVKGIQSQAKEEIDAIYWVNEEAKNRLERIIPQELNAKLTENAEYTKLQKTASHQANPVYAKALSKLHFIASGRSNEKAEALTTELKQTIVAHKKIRKDENNPYKPSQANNLAAVLKTSEKTRSHLINSIFQTRQLSCKAQVSTYLINTVMDDSSTLGSAQ